MSSRVTFLINNYQYEEFLPQCLDSIISQPYENAEFLLHDDCSTDRSVEIMKEYMSKDKRFTQLKVEEENNGDPCVGINWGLSVATGDFFSIVCTDDFLSPNFWESTLPYFDDPDVGIVRVALYNFGPYIASPAKLNLTNLKNPLDILEGNKINVTSPFRMSMQKQIGIFLPGNDTLLADWDFWIRCVLAGWKVADHNEPMFWHRTHYRSITVKGRYAFGLGPKDYEFMSKKWMPELQKYRVYLSTIWRDAPKVEERKPQ